MGQCCGKREAGYGIRSPLLSAPQAVDSETGEAVVYLAVFLDEESKQALRDMVPVKHPNEYFHHVSRTRLEPSHATSGIWPVQTVELAAWAGVLRPRRQLSTGRKEKKSGGEPGSAVPLQSLLSLLCLC